MGLDREGDKGGSDDAQKELNLVGRVGCFVAGVGDGEHLVRDGDLEDSLPCPDSDTASSSDQNSVRVLFIYEIEMVGGRVTFCVRS